MELADVSFMWRFSSSSMKAFFTIYSPPEIKEAMVKKYSMKNCKRCYILADASKFDQLSSVKFADFEQATILTTELHKPALKKYKNIVEVKE